MTEQELNNACAWLEKYMESLGYIDEWCRKGEDTFRKAMSKETQEQQDRRLAHADSLPKELVELETEFTDWWLKDHDFTPTFADAIGWARDKQRAELIGKACDWMKENYREFWGYIEYDDDPTEMFDLFRKAMTTKKNPLFEKCLSNVNPDTRAEVRRNMELTWHKASDELPEEEKEVIVIYDNGYLCYNHRPKMGGYYRKPNGEKVPYEPFVDEDGWCEYAGSTWGHKVVLWTDNPMED